MTRLRDALRDAPVAARILIHSNNQPLTYSKNSPPLAGEGKAGVFTRPMSDTVKEVVDGRVRRTVPRDTLVRVTGPWTFEREALIDALSLVAGRETPITDMTGLCESTHIRVRALATP